MQSSDTPIKIDASVDVQTPVKSAAAPAPDPGTRPETGTGPGAGTRPGAAASRKMWLLLGLVAAIVLPAVFALRQALRRELFIDSQPPGATVLINGRFVGKTPVRIAELPGGSYSVRLEKEDFAPLSVSVALGWGATRIAETLPPRGAGSLKVAVDPAGSEVLLDGEIIGQTPLELGGVPAGPHELLIRKTNFKAYAQRIAIEAGKPLEFKDFALEDLILTMLQNAIDKEPQRVANYMDMGHYLFANNKIRDAAQFYVRGIHVSAKPLTFAPDATAEERNLELQLRARDIERINDELRKKMAYTGHNLAQKEMKEFVASVTGAQQDVATQNTSDWRFVYEQARNFIEEKKFEPAERMYLRHIETAKGMETVAQAHISLIMLRIHYMQNVAQALAACADFAATPYANNPALARQAANTIYGNAGAFQGKDRAALLAQAEALLRRALANAPRRTPMSALCKFELANVLFLEERYEDAAALYKESVIETDEPTNRELRSQRQVDALRKLNRVDEARDVLKLLAKSPRPDIAAKANADLKELDASPNKPR